MNKKIVLSNAILILFSLPVYAKHQPFGSGYHVLGYDTCLSADQLSHAAGQQWSISGITSGWSVIAGKLESNLTTLPADAVVERKVEPYHLSSTYLADVTCNYQAGTVILKRSYKVGGIPFLKADYIVADSNITDKGWYSTLWNYTTTCKTTVSDLDKCHWAFVRENPFLMWLW